MSSKLSKGADMKRAYVDVPEGQVHYRTEGSGKVIFLLHKAGTRGEELHEAAFAYAAKVAEKLSLIKCPTLLIAAEKDHWTPVAPEVKKLIADCKFTPIPNGPVYVTRMMPREFADAILGFLGK